MVKKTIQPPIHWVKDINMRWQCKLYSYQCGEWNFIILIRGVSSTPQCASLNVEWKMTLEFIKLKGPMGGER